MKYLNNILCVFIFLNSAQLKEFTPIKTIKASGSVIQELKNESEYLSIEEIVGADKVSADLLVRDEILSIEAMYSNYYSAYPGDVSNEVACNEKFKAAFHSGESTREIRSYYLLYSNERFGLGACTEDIVKYKQLLGWIYCPKNKQLFKVKYFTPLTDDFEKLEKFFAGLKCP